MKGLIANELSKLGFKLNLYDVDKDGYAHIVTATHIKSGVSFSRHVRSNILKDCATEADKAKMIAAKVKDIALGMGFEV